MPKTSTEISFGLMDITAKPDVTAACDDKQDFIHLDDFKLEGVTPPQSATTEKNYWRLDGTFETFPDNPQNISWGLWSKQMANESGVFETPIVLNLNFSGLHSTVGVSFEFNPYGEDWCNDLNIKWYRDSALLYDIDFFPDRWNFSAFQNVENFNKIVITFNSMTKPYRFLKLQNVIYGILKYFESGEIVSGKISEVADITGASLPYNKLNFTVWSSTDEFNIYNPQGVYTLLQRKQLLQVTSKIDGFRVFWGNYYVDELEMNFDQTIEITGTDAIGIMDKTYFEGDLYTNKNAGDLVAEIMNDAGFAYSIDSELSNKTVNGFIPYSTHRDAIQMVAFAIGGYVSVARTGLVSVKKRPDIDDTPELNIGLDRKIVGSKAKFSQLVTAVEVTAYSYTQKPRNTEAGTTIDKDVMYQGALEIGENIIRFSRPVEPDTITTTHGTFGAYNHSYCIINSANEVEECTIKAYTYQETTRKYRYEMPEIPMYEKEKIVNISGCTLVNDSNALEIAEYVYNNEQLRLTNDFSVIPEKGLEIPGTLISMQTVYNEYRPCVIEEVETDIYGGLISDITAKGV